MTLGLATFRSELERHMHKSEEWMKWHEECSTFDDADVGLDAVCRLED
jgi:hypothetical protein